MPRLPAGFITRLEAEQHTRHYRKELARGLAHVRTWLAAQPGGSPLDLTRSAPRAVDDLLTNYVQACFDRQVHFSVVKHALLALQKLLRLRHRLPRAWGCLRAWQLRLPAAHRTPMPLDILKAMFAGALDGYLSGLAPLLLLPLAVLIRVAYFGLLRPSEAFRLRRADVYVGATSSGAPVAVVILRDPKNRAHMGRNQFATIHDPGTVAWLSWICCGLPPAARLWPSSAVTFRQLFRSVLMYLGLSDLPLSPGCLRPGGATRYFVDGMALGDLQYAGRWRSPQSLGAYVQEAMAHFAWLNMEDRQRADISACVRLSALVWAAAPATPRAQFGPSPRGWRRFRQTSPVQRSRAANGWLPLAM